MMGRILIILIACIQTINAQRTYTDGMYDRRVELSYKRVGDEWKKAGKVVTKGIGIITIEQSDSSIVIQDDFREVTFYYDNKTDNIYQDRKNGITFIFSEYNMEFFIKRDNYFIHEKYIWRSSQ